MGTYKEVEGNLITLAKNGEFDVITHGCNCLSQMGAGIAPQMAEAFACNEYYREREGPNHSKLGNIDHQMNCVYEKDGVVRIYNPRHDRLNFSLSGWTHKKDVFVVNSYTQYNYGRNHSDGTTKPLDYEALTLCMRKINHTFKGSHIGLPMIGAGLAGGDWNIIKEIIQKELKGCDITVVIFNPNI